MRTTALYESANKAFRSNNLAECGTSLQQLKVIFIIIMLRVDFLCVSV